MRRGRRTPRPPAGRERRGHADIAGAAEEQNNALAEVNIAVGQMDQATQQNAAMAEQANAAAESMKKQILQLRETVNAFKLAGGSASAAVRSVKRPETTPARLIRRSA